MRPRRWYLVFALAGTLVFGVYSFFNEPWMTHLPDGQVEDCIAAAPEHGITGLLGGGGRPTTSPPGLRCEINGKTFVIPASFGDYVALVFWSLVLGVPLGLLLAWPVRAVMRP